MNAQTTTVILFATLIFGVLIYEFVDETIFTMTIVAVKHSTALICHQGAGDEGPTKERCTVVAAGALQPFCMKIKYTIGSKLAHIN
jgi:hypothetical protein